MRFALPSPPLGLGAGGGIEVVLSFQVAGKTLL